MSISKDLFLAILAMDSYNRGYNPGVILPSNSGTQIGLANVGRYTNQDGQEQATVAASFFAQAYTLNGETIISYRGTDTEFFTGSDFPAFTMGAGFYATNQGNLALDFYRTVNGGNAAANPNISVVGHSLGGALAANDNAVLDEACVA